MLVERTDKHLIIKFPFNPVLVAIVGTFEGRTFDTKKKHWTVPLVHTVATVESLGKLGFSFSAGVVELYQAHKLRATKVERMKAGNFKESEKKMLEELGIPFFNYQKSGSGFMVVAESSLLGDQPGLGKTLQSIGSVRLKKSKRTLIFCPVVMKKSWQEEIAKWHPGATSIIVGGTPQQRLKQWDTEVDYHISNYHLLLRDIKLMKKIPWDSIIADEATAVANPKSKTAKELKKLKAPHKVALTGTPLSNSVEDVWSIMDWVQPGLLGSFWQFTEEYCCKDDNNAIVSYKNLNKLKEKIAPFMLRRLKKDVLTELPPKLYENIHIEFSDEERKLYNAIKEETLDELAKAKMFDSSNLDSALVKMIRMKQMTGSSELINGVNTSSKLTALKELLSVIMQNDEKTIVFTQFREMAVILMRELASYKPLLIAGGVKDDERDENRHAFNTDDEHRLLIMTSAGNMGLNLQRASIVIHYDLPWSMAMAEQREDRAHRNGQTRNVLVYRLLVEDSIDEYNLLVLNRKKVTSDSVLGDNDAETARKAGLTKQDFINILT